MGPACSSITKRLALILAGPACLLVAAWPALAEVTRVVVKDSGPMGTFGEREYTWVSADMEGTVAREDGTTGHYRVPVSLYYPDRDSNGFGFVDVINMAYFSAYTDETAPNGKRQVSYTGDHIFSDFLRWEGFTYISALWSRTITEELGADYGIIENGLDGYEITRDAARLLRSPERLKGQLPFEPEAVDWIVGHGQSSTATYLRGFVRRGENRDQRGELAFDGFLVSGSRWGNNCLALNNDDTPRDRPGLPTIALYYESVSCVERRPEDGKIILIRTQTRWTQMAMPWVA